MPSRFGGAVANAMGSAARVLGYGIYWLLRIIYRPKERLIAIGVVLAVVAMLALIWWLIG